MYNLRENIYGFIVICMFFLMSTIPKFMNQMLTFAMAIQITFQCHEAKD